MSSFQNSSQMPLQTANPAACSVSEQCGSTNVGETERVISTIAGALLVLSGMRKGAASGLCTSLAGGGLLYRGLTGHCHMYHLLGVNTSEPGTQASLRQGEGYRIHRRVLVNRPPEELYGFWRNLDNLPRVFDHLVSVRQKDATHSHWVAKGPMNTSVEWDAEIIEEREGELIAWRSMPGASVSTAGSIHFRKVPEGTGTEVTVALRYSPPAGAVGRAVAQLLDQSPEDQIAEELENFKEMMESHDRQPLTTSGLHS